jgi:hypothetical protein
MHLPSCSAPSPCTAPAAALAASASTWYRRLKHPDVDALSKLSSDSSVVCSRHTHDFCHACQLGCHTRMPFVSSTSRTDNIFDLIHCDMRTSPIVSISSYTYYQVILDDHSHFVWTFPLQVKSDTFSLCHIFSHLRVFGCACYPNLSAKAAQNLAPRSTKCVFLGYSTYHKGHRCLDLTTKNIIASRHVVFNEVDFSFSASPRLTNNLDILLQDDSPGADPMLAVLSVPRVPPGFPPLTVASGQTALRTEAGGLTTSGTEVGSPTATPSSQTPPEQRLADRSLGGQTAWPFAASSSPASLTSTQRP